MQSLFQLELDQQRQLVNKYYSIYDPLMRELAGRKLTGYLRKALDDVAERLHIPLQMAERGFDNLRRIYKRSLECVEWRQPVLPVLRQQHLLSDALAHRYMRAAYVRFHRWELHKKKLAPISFADIEYMARTQMQRWVRHDVHPFAIDAGLRTALREYRSTLSNDKHALAAYAARALAAARPLLERQLAERLDSKLVSLFLKPLLQVAADLSSAKQFRDFVPDLYNKFIVPLSKQGVSSKDCEVVLGALTQHSGSADFVRFLQGFTPCLMRIKNLDLN